MIGIPKSMLEHFLYVSSSHYRAAVAREIKHQEDIVKILCVLPGKYGSEQVEDAIKAADVIPMDIYESIIADNHTFALARFYEALKGPK